MNQKCKNCGTTLKMLFTSVYCPADCKPAFWKPLEEYESVIGNLMRLEEKETGRRGALLIAIIGIDTGIQMMDYLCWDLRDGSIKEYYNINILDFLSDRSWLKYCPE